jgi:hypothetical protein
MVMFHGNAMGTSHGIEIVFNEFFSCLHDVLPGHIFHHFILHRPLHPLYSCQGEADEGQLPFMERTGHADDPSRVAQ